MQEENNLENLDNNDKNEILESSLFNDDSKDISEISDISNDLDAQDSLDVEDSFEPILGSRQQAEAMIEYLNQNPENISNMEMFGRPLITMLNDGINSKLQDLPENSKQKLQKALKIATSKQKSNIIVFVF